MDLNEYIKMSYKRPNRKVLEGLGASEDLIEYLMETPWNTNWNVIGSIMNSDGGGQAEVWWTGVFDDVTSEINEGNAYLIDTNKTNYNALFSNPSNYSILFNGTEMSYDGYNENYGRHTWKGGTFRLYVYTPYEQDPAAAMAFGYNITKGLEVEVLVKAK